MAYLNRIIVDLVTEEPLSPRRLENLAAETSHWLHVMGAESDDQPINVRDKHAAAHEHDATGDRCSSCYYEANDSKNGDVLV